MKDNIYAFIDSQNLNLGVQSQGWKLDFRRFHLYLQNKYKVTKAFLFIGYIQEKQMLYANLKKAGYILIFKPVLEIVNRQKKQIVKIKGNVDAELVLHTMIEYPHYDKAVVVSGDGDFHCLVEYLAGKHKLGKIIVPNQKYSSLLRHFSPFIVNIGLLKNNLEYQQKKTGIRGRSKP